MGLLDDLKKRAAAKEAATHGTQDDNRAQDLLAVALPALFRIHQVLGDLVKQLRILGDEAPVTLKVAGVGEVPGFLQGNYDISAEGRPPQTVSLRCNLRLARPRPLEITTAGASPTAWADRLRQHGAPIKVLRVTDARGPNQKAVIGIDGTIPVLVQFSIDVEHAAVQLLTRNFDELVERRQYFNPADVTEQWCEELLKYVLREENSFLRHEVSTDVREQLRRRLEWEKLKDQSLEETTETRVAASGMLKQFFRRPPQLKIEWRGLTWDLATHVGAFTLGRVSDCDLRIRRDRVSRFHARIEYREGEYHLTDDSTNGTFVHFSDGRRQELRKSSMVLQGSGVFALGDEASEDNPDLVHFVM